MRRNLRPLAVLALLACVPAAGACGRKIGPSEIPTLTTETFAGTLQPLGTSSHSFTVRYLVTSTDASVTVTSLTAVSSNSPANVTIGVAFGNANTGVCTRAPSYTNVAARLNEAVRTVDVPFTGGVYCVQIFDNPANPTVTEPLNYSLSVTHY